MSLFIEKIKLKTESLELKAETNFFQLSRIWKICIVIILIFSLPAYFLTRLVAKKIWEKKYEKFLITAKPSFEKAEPLKTENALISEIAPNIYALAVLVKNPNFELGAKNVGYEFELYDQSGVVITEAYGEGLKGKTHFLPSENKYLVAAKILSQKKVASVKVNFPNIVFQRRKDLPYIKLQTSKPKIFLQTQPGALVVEGGIYNNSPYFIKTIKITFLVYDRAGNFLAASSREEYDLKAFESRGYKQLWPNLMFENADAKIFVETNTADGQNVRFASPENQSGNLDRPEYENNF